MKLKKKIVALSTILGLLVSIFSPFSVYAAETTDVDTILHNHGVPEKIINIMPEKQKLELVNAEEFSFIGETTVQSTMEKPSGIAPRGTISSSELSLTGYGFMYTSGGKKLASISAYYNWIKAPTWYLTDQIGLTWDSTYYESVPGEHWICWQHQNLDGTHLTTTTSYDARELSKDSVIFDVDMKANYTNFGVATITLQLKSGKTEPSSSFFYFKYAHDKILPNIGLSISDTGAGISISGSIYTDGLASSASFSR